MKVPEEIRKIERLVNTYVVAYKTKKGTTYYVRSHKGCRYDKGRRLPISGPTVGYINSLILQPYSITNPTPPTPISCATILKTILDSNSNGAMLFQYFLIDGRTFAAIAQSSQIRAANKEFFLGSNAKNWQSSYPNIYFKQSKDKVLIIALNDLNKSRECSFTTPNGKIVKLALLPWEVKLMYYNLTSKSFYSK